jgi:hypothetical protein
MTSVDFVDACSDPHVSLDTLRARFGRFSPDRLTVRSAVAHAMYRGRTDVLDWLVTNKATRTDIWLAVWRDLLGTSIQKFLSTYLVGWRNGFDPSPDAERGFIWASQLLAGHESAFGTRLNLAIIGDGLVLDTKCCFPLRYLRRLVRLGMIMTHGRSKHVERSWRGDPNADPSVIRWAISAAPRSFGYTWSSAYAKIDANR